jgi:hypothetical protein
MAAIAVYTTCNLTSHSIPYLGRFKEGRFIPFRTIGLVPLLLLVCCREGGLVRSSRAGRKERYNYYSGLRRTKRISAVEGAIMGGGRREISMILYNISQYDAVYGSHIGYGLRKLGPPILTT